MPHAEKHRTHHCMVRQTLVAISKGRKSRGRPRRCEALIGCTVEQLYDYLGFQQGEQRCIDHIIPLSQGGDNHYTNLRMLPEDEHQRRPATATPEEVAAVALLRLRHVLRH